MHPIIFEWGKITVHSWGLMLSLALIISTLLLLREARIQGLNPDFYVDLVILVVLGGLIGARIFYILIYDLEYFLANPLEMFKFWEGGLVFYGGLIGGLLVGYIYLKYHKICFWHTADLLAPFLALGYGIVRIGCFLNGCCYGQPTTVAWSVSFPSVDHVLRHPTQLYLSTISFIIFFGLYFLLRNKKFDGQVILTYIILYSVARGGVESLRDNLLILPHVTIAQLVSVVIFIIGVFMYFRKVKRGSQGD